MDSQVATGSAGRPKPSKTETRAEITDHAARAIITAEAERREAKTARLRQARLEREAAMRRAAAAAASSRPQRMTNRKKG